MENFDNFLELDESLTIDPVSLSNDFFYISINGRVYGYQANSGGNIQEIAETFKKMLKYSAGRALAWLKKNTQLVSGSVKEGEDSKMKSFQEFRDGHVNEKMKLMMRDLLNKMIPSAFGSYTDVNMRKELSDAVAKAIEPILLKYNYIVEDQEQ